MIALIAAVARNGIIGKDGKIPWHLPADLKRFKQLTMGHVLIMGRKTYESIGRPLPGRETVVLSRTFHSQDPSDLVSHATSFDLVLEWVSAPPPGRKDWFICGGAEVYREALERDIVDRQYRTEVDADFEGDTFMPAMPAVPGGWAVDSYEFHHDEKPPYGFVVLNRVR